MTPEKEEIEFLNEITEKVNTIYSRLVHDIKQEFDLDNYTAEQKITKHVMILNILSGVMIASSVLNRCTFYNNEASDAFTKTMHEVRGYAESQLEHYLSEKK